MAKKVKDAAITIQKWWRKYKPSYRFRYRLRDITVLLMKVHKIQRWWRFQMLRKAIRWDKRQKLRRIVYLQGLTKNFLKRRTKEKVEKMKSHFDFFAKMQEDLFTNSQIKIAYYWRKKLIRLRKKKAKAAKKKAAEDAKKAKRMGFRTQSTVKPAASRSMTNTSKEGGLSPNPVKSSIVTNQSPPTEIEKKPSIDVFKEQIGGV